MRMFRGKTLEEDINYIWKQHGLQVMEESVHDNTWTIKARRIVYD